MTVYPVQPGHPDYSSDSANKAIPAVYSALLVKKFYPQTIFGSISQTDYEGDIKDSGDTVYIRTRPTIETFRYKKGMVLPVQNPESPYITLKIDQGEGFSFALDKVDDMQSDLNQMNIWAEDAAAQMKQVIDRNVLVTVASAAATALSGAPATNIEGYTAGFGPSLDEATIAKGFLVNGAATSRGTTVALGTDTAPALAGTGNLLLARILAYGRYLDENNAPTEGRFVVLPTWASSVLKSMENNNFGLAYATGQNTASAISGQLPKIDRFDVHFSNNLPQSMNTTMGASDAGAVIFGCKYATTFATQITESRVMDNPFAFGKMMQGLQVYGFNIIKPPMIGVDFIENAAA